MKVALIFDHFGPYHLARARAAADAMEVTCIELHAKSRSYGWDAGKPARDVELVALPETDLRGAAERKWLESHLARALHEAKPDAVAINGWGDFMSTESLRWCMRNGVPAIVMSETTAWDEPRKAHREWIKSRMVRMFSAGLAGGTPQREYLAQLGLLKEVVEIGYDAVDNGHFAERAAEVRKGWRVKSHESRVASEGEEGASYFLASARFIPKKNLGRLIDAYAQYRLASTERGAGSGELWHLVLLGDGPMRGELVQRALELGLEVREGAPWESAEGVAGGEWRVASEGTDVGGVLWLAGFRQIGELPRFYAGAGCFVHASTTEQWGLVVNEAMACGLPVIVSKRCGCARDLVQDCLNGFNFDPRDVAQLAALMAKVSAPDFPRADFGEASRRIVADFGPERFAHGLKAAASHAIGKGAHRPSPLDRLILNLVCRR